MGFCADKETTHGLVDFELRRESVCFHEDEQNAEHIFGHLGHVELSKDYLRRLDELLQDPEWRAQLLE